MESWYKDYCPDCGTANWMNNGDESNLDEIDVEGIKCYECGKIWYLGNEEEYEFISKIKEWNSVEDCNWVKGLEKPE